MNDPIMHAVVASSLACAVAAAEGDWKRLADIPDPEGFAGSFAGVVEGRLVVAGGANFPDKKPWEGGTKHWHDRVFTLAAPEAEWREAGRLPRPLGYGVAVTTPTGVACIGGADADAHHADAFEIRLAGDGIRVVPLPTLPVPLANACGALVGHKIFVCCGSETPDAVAALARGWVLDLGRPEAGWKEIPSLPGPGRILAAAGAVGDTLVVAGGADLSKGPDDKLVRTLLRDAYAFDSGQGWRRVADLPHPVAAAPSPMPLDAAGRLLVMSGDDGSQAAVPPEKRHGFPREILAWDPAADAWVAQGEVAEGLVTTTAVTWRGRIVVPGGEARPGVRSNKVWSR